MELIAIYRCFCEVTRLRIIHLLTRGPLCVCHFQEILGLPRARSFGPFRVIDLSNGVSLDFHEVDGPIHVEHYAFLVSEAEFDQIFGRIQEAGIAYYADPWHRRPDQINHNDGGRGAYFADPNGHNLEVITRPYGTGP